MWVLPGHADESMTVHFGYGRTRAGRIANGVGFNAYPLRATNALWHVSGASIERKSRGYKFANTQHTQTMEERDPFRAATLAEYHSDPDFARPEEKQVPDEHTLFPLWQYNQHKWGMSIDLTACVGCQACMVACQSENNIADRRKGGSRQGPPHELASRGSLLSGLASTIRKCISSRCRACIAKTRCASWYARWPRRCTAAKGLNEMVYNRCVGTRYCSNNCPYKVRRFNFFLYSDWDTQSLYGVRNPDVTRAQPRRDGKVQLLRAAHQSRQDRRRKSGSAD